MESLKPKRHASNAEELESLLLEGFLSGAPVEEEITAEAALACGKHADPVQPLISLPQKVCKKSN